MGSERDVPTGEGSHTGEGSTRTPTGELPALTGQTVAGRYRVLKKLGEGGMGTVYLAEHITIEKKVALKVLLQEYARKRDLKERFLQEAKAAAKIGHENIVDITDFGATPDGSVFFAMEYLEGKDLAQLIREEGAVPWPRAKIILLQICRALGAAHAKGIVHRDMKPENIYLVEREGRSDFVKLLDFGIAKMNIEDKEKRLTRTGMIFGTPEYMSPEQAQGNPPDHRVDVYAVGVIMYEMLTGRVPFKADTFMGILTKHIFESPLPPSQVNPKAAVPLPVEEVILRAMAKDRNDRFQSMTELAAAVARVSGRMTRPTSDVDVTTDPRRITSPSQSLSAVALASGPTSRTDGDLPSIPRRRTGLVIGALAALVLLGGGAAFVIMQRGDSPGTPPDRRAGGASVGEQPRAQRADVAAAQTVRVSLSSTPPGAAVFRGSSGEGKQPLGVTPTRVDLPRGTKGILFTLRLEGHEDQALHVTPDMDRDLTVQLTRRPAETPPPVVPPPVDKVRPPPRTEKGTVGAKARVAKKRGREKRGADTTPPEKKTGEKKTGEKVNDLMNPFD